MHCYIDTLPSEIVSEVLLNVIESFGDNFRLKWRCPLLFRRVSKRFHHITTHTCSFWQYLYIAQPLLPYLQTYIAHSGTLPLVVDVVYRSELAEEGGDWMAVINTLAPVYSRVKTLIVHSPQENRLIIELLRHQMPVLQLLDLTGEGPPSYEFPASHFPTLQSLRSAELFDFESISELPQTLTVLHLRRNNRGDLRPSRPLWDSLPRNLRVLQIENIMWVGMAVFPNHKVHLPCLTDLCFEEFCIDDQHSILQRLDAPRLQTLTVFLLNFYGAGLDSADWFPDFPGLERLTWKCGSLPRMDLILRRCSALKYLHLDSKGSLAPNEESVSGFLNALTEDPTLLPLLQDFVVWGVVIPGLESLAHVRPRLGRLEVLMDGFSLGPETTLVDGQLA